DRRSTPAPRNLLCGFGLTPNLLLDLPVRKQIFVAATRTVPSTLYRVGAALVEHLHDQVTMQTHCRMTIDLFACLCGFGYCGFRHDCHFINLLLKLRTPTHFPDVGVSRVKTISYNCLQIRACSRSYTDGEIIKR